MNRIDKTINELCPDGVEYKKLGEVAEMKRGTSATKKDFEKGTIPVISGGKEPAFYCNKNNRDGETITVAGSGAGAGYVQYWNTPVFVNDAFSIKGNEKLLTKYIFYCLCNIQDKIYATKKGGGVPHVHISSIENLLIPVPPLEVQREILQILDEYSNSVIKLKLELEKELELRKKQYQYYMDKLLTFGNEIERKTLEEIGIKFYRGSGIKKDDLTENGIPCIRYGEIYTTYGIHFNKCVSYTDENNINSKKYIEYGDILFAVTGESIEDIAKSTAYTGREKCLVGGDILVMKHNQNPKYLSYALSTTNARIQKSKGKIKSKVVHASLESIKKIKIPVPPVEEQERIVKILDRFDKLCNDLTDGIPAEIEARQKQYEYYREKLLTF